MSNDLLAQSARDVIKSYNSAAQCKFDELSWSELDGAAFARLEAALASKQAPPEWTPEMSRAVQLYSELGAYAAANLSGAYDLFEEFWRVAIQASRPAEAQAKSEPAALTDAQLDAAVSAWVTYTADNSSDFTGRMRAAIAATQGGENGNG